MADGLMTVETELREDRKPETSDRDQHDQKSSDNKATSCSEMGYGKSHLCTLSTIWPPLSKWYRDQWREKTIGRGCAACIWDQKDLCVSCYCSATVSWRGRGRLAPTWYLFFKKITTLMESDQSELRRRLSLMDSTSRRRAACHYCPNTGCFQWCCCCCSWSRAMRNREKDRLSRRASSISRLESPRKQEDSLTLDEVSSWTHSFDLLLANPAGRSVFAQFLRTEHSDENMLFWLACEELKSEQCAPHINESAKKIYLDYISILSPKEVSIDATVREMINRSLATPNAHMFDEAQGQVYALMHRDSYPRFLNSLLYKSLVQRLSTLACDT